MKKIMCVLLSGIFVLTAASCREEPSATSSSSSSSQGTSVSTEGITGEGEYHHEFNPHVYPKIYEDNFDEATKNSFFSLCDALLSGSEEFECPDPVTLFNIKDHISGQCMPLVDSYVKIDEGTIEYTIPKDQYLAKVDEFKKMIIEILDECDKPEYSDVDTALALYTYFETHYTYDDEAAKDDNTTPLSSYRLLTEKTGICQEIAPAYAYLMLQSGIDCTTCGSLNNINEAHEWAFATLDGEYYHIDPTFVISDPETLQYFGMTDEQRHNEGGWDVNILNFGLANIFDDRGIYKAESKRFEPLWDSVTYEVDYDLNTIDYYKLSDASKQSFTY